MAVIRVKFAFMMENGILASQDYFKSTGLSPNNFLMVKVTMAIWQFLRIGVTTNSILGVKFGSNEIFRSFFFHKHISFWEHCSRHIVINGDGNSFAQTVTVFSMLIKASVCDNYSLGMIMMNSAYADCRLQDMDAFSLLLSDKVPEYLGN